jgi:hypothetical protein
MKEVIERFVIIHPSFGRGMLPMSDEESRIGIMVFKFDEREVISLCDYAHPIVIDFAS